MRVHLVRSRIAARGEAELTRLSGAIPVTGFRLFLIRHLGTGACLTEFLIAGTGADRVHASHVASLGGIANAIIAAFDHLVDTGKPADLLRLAQRLPFNPRPRELHLPVSTPEDNPDDLESLTYSLITLYFQRLRALKVTNPGILKLTERAIERMYRAEMRTATGSALVSRSVWWRKNTLPIAVMGLPAWLASGGGPFKFGDHLRWLCRAGEFLGWIDDCADYEEDRDLGQANRIVTLAPNQSLESIARGIARLGQRVMTIWDDRNPISPARDTFDVIVWTWINNPGTTPIMPIRLDGSHAPLSS
jgi:hypothetical protein